MNFRGMGEGNVPATRRGGRPGGFVDHEIDAKHTNRGDRGPRSGADPTPHAQVVYPRATDNTPTRRLEPAI